jgi:hypothetical protein
MKLPKSSICRFILVTVFALLIGLQSFGQTPVPMASYTAAPYVENFTDIGTWVNTSGTFSVGSGAAAWKGYTASTTSVSTLPRIVPNPAVNTVSTAVFASGTGGGLQKGSTQIVPVTALVFLPTGSTDSTTSHIVDFFMDFTGATAGTLSYDAFVHTNPAGAAVSIYKKASIFVYWSIDGTTWTQIPTATYTGTNYYISSTTNILKDSASITGITLPAAFNNSASARLRFYAYNSSSPGASGNRPRLCLDKLEVTANAGCATPLTTTLTSPTSPQIICNGSAVTLSASTTGTANAITHTWAASTAPVVAGLSVTNGASVTATPTATTTYTVTATSGACVATTSTTITVNNLPTVAVSPTSITVCAGGSQSFTATGASTYAWSPAIDLNDTSVATVTSIPTANRTYTVSGTDANGCLNTATASLNYVSGLSVSVSPASATLNCVGDFTTLTASGANAFTWANSAGLSSTTTDATVANPTSTTTYTVTGTAGACSGSTVVVVTVNNNPIPTVAIAASPAAVCIGSSSNLTASGADTYTWNTAASLSATAGTNVTAIPTAATTYTVTGTTTAGCSSTSTLLLTVNALPTVTAAVTPSLLCVGNSATLTGNGAVTYSWSNGGTAQSITESPTTNTTYTVTGTDANSCTKTTSVAVNVTSSSALAYYSFQTANPFLGNYDSLFQCNTNIAYVSGIKFGNQNGAPNNQYPTGTGIATYAGQTATGAGTNNAGAACIAGLLPLNTSASTYMQFDVVPACGYGLSLNSLSFGNRSTGTGPVQLTLFTSADNFTNPVATMSAVGNSAWAFFNPSFSPITSSSADTLKVRIYGSNGSGSGGTATVNWRIDDIKLGMNTFTITPNYPIIAVTPNYACAGVSTILTAAGASGTYAWSPAPDSIKLYGANAFINIPSTTSYTVTANNGACISTAAISVNVASAASATNLTLCPSALPYTWNTQIITTAGTYTFSALNVNGCDSVATLNLSIGTTSSSTNSISLCPSQLPYSWNSQSITTAGTYTFTTSNSQGCDSTANLVVTLLAASNSNTSVAVASSSLPYNWNGTNYAIAGTYTQTYTNAAGCDSIATLVLTVTAPPANLQVAIKVLLSGPFNPATGLMSDSLNTLNLIPTTEPYSSAPYAPSFSHVGGGGEVTTSSVLSASTGSNRIVDWVFVQIRSAINPSVVLTTQSALLQADGDVVSAADGVSPLSFANLNSDNYYISIKHRNHNGVMTANAMALSATPAICDFTSSSFSLYALAAPNNNPSPLNGAARMQNGKRTLYAGNCLSNNALNKRVITYNSIAAISDRLALYSATGGSSTISGYSIYDFDFNGKATYNGINSDRAIMQSNLLMNNSLIIQEQTPN